MDQVTGRSRGTGFACFWNKDDADKAVELSSILRTETTGGVEAVCFILGCRPLTSNEIIQPRKNPFSMPSILTPDPSASSAQSLVLHGRTLDVVRAVTRDQAVQLKAEGEKAREKADKRNMYLLREGGKLPLIVSKSKLIDPP
jgi:nucleolar protein 4